MAKFEYEELGNTHRVYPGKYKVDIFKPGYKYFSECIYIDNTPNSIEKSFTLEPQTQQSISFPIKKVSTDNGCNILLLDNNNNLFIRSGIHPVGLGPVSSDVGCLVQITPDLLPDTFTFPVMNIYSAIDAFYITDNNGHVYSCGTGYVTGLGASNDNESFNLFTKVEFPIGVVYPILKIEGGYYASFAIDSANKLYACVSSSQRKSAGFNTGGNISTFTLVDTSHLTSLDLISDISYMISHTIFTDGSNIYVSGSNEIGELGVGDYVDVSRFTLNSQLPIEMQYPIKKVCVGYNDSYIIDNIGNLYSCGDNGYGKLALGTKTIIDYETGDIITDADENKFIKVPLDISPDIISTPIKDIISYLYNTIIIDSNGKLFISGDSVNGIDPATGYPYGSVFTKIDLPSTTNIDIMAFSDLNAVFIDNTNNKIYIYGSYNHNTKSNTSYGVDKDIIIELII